MRRLISAILCLALPATALAERDCSEWEAVYAGLPDEAGHRVFAALGPVRGTEPVPLVFTGQDADGKTNWEHRTKAWCFLGSGGCYTGLAMAGGAPPVEESGDLYRVVFLRGDADPAATPDILVIAGLNTAFLDAQAGRGPFTLALTRHAGEEDEPVIAPEVYYFDRCRSAP